MDVYVLTSIMEGGIERPVAVTTDQNVANQWIREGKDNDWIPFELDDLSTTGMAKGTVTPFKPKPPQPAVEAVEEMNKQLQSANEQLQKIVKALEAKLKYYAQLMGKRSSLLLRKQDDSDNA